jgi:predicted nucleic acid-binding protein
MKKVFLDSNVILDSILKREGYETVNSILQFGEDNYFRSCTSILSFANIAYILRKYKQRNGDLEQTMKSLFDCIKILPMGDMQVYNALLSDRPDFEDALQVACAEESGCDLIITRDKKHFGGVPIPVYTPDEFLRAVTE